MSSRNDYKIRITADSSGVKSGVNAAKGELNSIAKTSESAASSISRMGQSLAGLAAVNFSVSGIVQAADAWSALNAQLSIATGGAKAGAVAYAEVLRIATSSGQSLETVGTIYRRFAENAESLGLSLKGVASISETVAQAMALSGGSAESAQAALFQFGQALASGQLRGEELNSVLEQAPRLARALADGLGVPVGKLRELAEAGQLTSDALVRSLGRSSAKVAAEFEQLPVTVSRALQNLRTEFTDTVGSFEQSTGAFAGLARVVDGVAKNMDVLVAAGGALAAVMGGRLVSSLAASAAAKVADTAAAVKNHQAMAAAAVASQQFAAAKLAEAQAAVAAATGMQRLSVVQNTLVPAQRALASATTAASAATTASSVAAGLASRALGALGGPIGLVTTALSLGVTAWAIWGNKAEDATNDAAKAADQNLESIINKVRELNERLTSTSRRTFDATLTVAEGELRTVQAKTSALYNQLDTLDARGGRYSEEGRRLQADLDVLYRREIALQAEVGAARENSARVGIDALNEFVSANAVGTDKLVADRAKVLSEFAKAIEQTGGVFNANIPEHARALDVLNAKLADMEKSGKQGAAGLSAAEKAAKKAAQEAAQHAAEIEKTNAAWRDSIANEAQKITEADDKTTASLREQYETLGLTTAELANYLAAKLDTASAAEAHAAAELETAAVLLDLQNQLPEVARSYRELASARRAASAQLSEQAQLTRASAEKQANIEAAQAAKENAAQAAQDWQRTADAIEDALIDALMEGGKSGKEYIEGLFRTMVLRPVVQAIVQPIAGSVTSAMGVGQPGQGTLGSSGSIGLPPGIGSTSMISTGLQWAGSALGSATLSSFGAGMSMTTAQIANLSSAGLINGTAASLGSTVAAAMPYIGAALFAAQALGLFDKKPSDKSSWASFDPNTGKTFDVGSMTGKKDPGQEQRDATAALAALTGVFAGLAGIDASVTAMIGGRDGTRLRINRDEGTQGFLTPQAGVANGNNSLNYGNGEDAIRKMLDDLVDEGALPTEVIEQWRTLKTDAQGVARDAVELVSTLNLLTEGYDTATIERANLLQTEGEMLEQSVARMEAIEKALSGTALPGDAMASAAADMVKEFERLNKAVPLSAEALGQVISGLDLTTTGGQAAYQSLMALAPAFLELEAAQASLYNGLLTDEQRLSKAAGEYAEAFKQLGVSMPENREGLLDLLGSFDRTTESGASLYAQILTLGAGFLETEEAAKQLEDQRKDSYRKLLSDEENLALDRKSLADEFEKLGYTLPKSKDQLRGWIDALNKSADVAGSEKERLQGVAEAYDKTFGGSTGFEAFINSAGQTEEEARKTANGLIALIEATLDYQAALDKAAEAARNAREEATRAYTATALDRRTAAIESLRSPEELAARDARQLAEISRGLTSSFEKLGFDLPNSLEGLRGFFEQIGGLPNWASTGPTAENALLDLVAPFIEYMELKDKVLGTGEATSSDDAIERARDNLRAAYEDQRASLEKTRDAMRGFVDSLKQYRTSLLMGDKSPLNPLEKYRLALAEFETASALAATGDEEALGKLKSVSDALLDASRQMYASGDAYSADFDKVLSALDAAGIAATIEETLAQQSLDQLEIQVGALIDINASVLSVEAAIRELVELTGGVSTGGVGNFVSDGYIRNAYQTVLGRSADDGGLAYWKQQIVSGAVAPESFNRALAEGAIDFDISAYKGNVPVSTLTDSQRNALAWLKANGIPGYADGGMHAGGLRVVGERGMEIEATGPARYWNFNQTQQMMGGSPELLAEVRALRAEVAALRQQQASEHREAVAANYDANDRNATRIAEATERIDRQRRTAERFA